MKNFEEIKRIVDKANKYLKGEETDPLFYENFGDHKTVQDMTKLLKDKKPNDLGLNGKKLLEKLMILYLFSKGKLKEDVSIIFEAIDENLGSGTAKVLEKFGRQSSFAKVLQPKLSELIKKKHELDDNSIIALRLIIKSLQEINRFWRPAELINNLIQKIESNIETPVSTSSTEEDRQKGCLDRLISKLKGFFDSSEPNLIIQEVLDPKEREEASKLLEELKVKTNLFSKFFSRHINKNKSIDLAIAKINEAKNAAEISVALNSAKNDCYKYRTSITKLLDNKCLRKSTSAYMKIGAYLDQGLNSVVI